MRSGGRRWRRANTSRFSVSSQRSMSTASRRGRPTVATGDCTWLNLSPPPGMHYGGQGRAVAFREGRKGAPWLLPVGARPWRGRRSGAVSGMRAARHCQLLGTRVGCGVYGSLTDSLEGTLGNPATRGYPHREGTRLHRRDPTLSWGPVSSLITTSCGWEDPTALVT